MFVVTVSPNLQNEIEGCLKCLKVIPLMAFVNAYFGEELRETSNKANFSIAAISAYLNEVCFSWSQVTTTTLSDINICMVILNIDLV